MKPSKLVNELQRGDQLALNENNPGVVTKCQLCPIIEIKGDRAYEIEWRDSAGETGRAIQAGRDLVELSTQAKP